MADPGGSTAAAPVKQEFRNVSAAVAYARLGWPVFPLMPGGKVPYPRSRGYLDATTDPGRIRRWWAAHPDANVGVATGAPGPDVLDVDVKPSGTGYPALRRLASLGQLTGVRLWVGTPSTGAHLYFAGTERRSGALPRLHLDYKARGGYVVAPPSQVAGTTYEVVGAGEFSGSFDWAAARQLLAPPPPGRPANAESASAGGPGYLLRWLGGQSEGNRNRALFWAALRAIEGGYESMLGRFVDVAVARGLPRGAAERTVASARKTVAAEAA